MTTIPTKLLFFDLPTQVSKPTSPNTWKLRLVLNFKRLSYTTHWTPTSLLPSVAEQFGIPPSGTYPDGSPHYTVPALIDFTPSEPVKLSDSTRIIEYLERTYPTPDIPVDADDDYPYPRVLFPAHSRTLHALVEHHIMTAIRPPLYELFTMALWKTRLPIDQEGFLQRKARARGLRTGEDLQVNDPTERDAIWKRLEDGFRTLAQIAETGERYARMQSGELSRTSAGDLLVFQPPYITYADIALCSLLITGKGISVDELWPRLSEWDGGRWSRLYEEVICRWGTVKDEMKVVF